MLVIGLDAARHGHQFWNHTLFDFVDYGNEIKKGMVLNHPYFITSHPMTNYYQELTTFA